MFTSSRKIWIALLTLVALSVISVADYTPSAVSKHSAFDPAITTQAHISDAHCTDQVELDEVDSSEQSCCTSTCPISFPVSFAIDRVITQPSRLALIATETSAKSDAFNNALFKPPIS